MQTPDIKYSVDQIYLNYVPPYRFYGVPLHLYHVTVFGGATLFLVLHAVLIWYEQIVCSKWVEGVTAVEVRRPYPTLPHPTLPFPTLPLSLIHI